MLSSMTGLLSIFVFLVIMFICIKLGQWIGKKAAQTSGLTITEGAVFTLMALLVAFTFSSANQRFDLRRSMIVEEANAIGTAYLRLDILQPSDQSILKNDFIDYLSARIAIYQAIPDFKKVDEEMKKSRAIQSRLWHDAITACKNVSIQTVPMLILPPINMMFDIASTRTAYTNFHPHFLVFLLMILVALLSAILTGYGMATKGKWTSPHVIAYVVITTITIYIIIDLEYPRLGFIKETAFDKQLIDLKNNFIQDKFNL
jgi:hypothetical protein